MTCSKQDIDDLVELFKQDEASAMRRLDALSRDHPDDAQLYFLKGSLFASQGNIAEGHRLMTRSLELAPDYDIARFQLGLLELTSGEAVAAQQTWAPFVSYPTDNFLRSFVDGLGCLIRDEFPQAIALLESGIAANDVIPQMNGDMQMIIDQISTSADKEQSAASETHLLLQRYNLGETRH